MPSVAEEFRKHAAEYYAPKNFNFWYFFGALSMLVLVIQIVSGIFLTMNYKPDAALAFGSVEYIMRDVPGGWLIRYIHSTGASAFFVVRLPAHVPRPAVRLVQAAARTDLDLRRADLPHADGRGLLRLPAALGPDVLLGRAGDREPVRHHPLHRAGPVALDPRRLRGRRRDAEPLLRAARDRDPAGAARAWWRRTSSRCTTSARTIRTASRSRRRRARTAIRSTASRSIPYYTVKDIAGRGGVHDGVLRDHVLRAGDGRLLPRVQQLHPRRSAEDPARTSRRSGTSRRTTRSCARCRRCSIRSSRAWWRWASRR